MKQNLHAHSTWDDGKNTPREMILAAKAAGLDSIGLSLHSPLAYDNEWAAKAQDVGAYLEEMARLKREFAGEIAVYCGVEWDVESDVDLTAYDYVIGSVHHLPAAGLPTVDESAQATRRFLEESFGGNADAAAQMFYAQYARAAENPMVDIVGHFDLLTKFDERERFFNESSPAYREAAMEAMGLLCRREKIFEVNTGAISRGYRKTPYPSRCLLGALREMGGRATISADAHSIDGVACAYEQARELLLSCGFEEIWVLGEGGFAPCPLKA